MGGVWKAVDAPLVEYCAGDEYSSKAYNVIVCAQVETFLKQGKYKKTRLCTVRFLVSGLCDQHTGVRGLSTVIHSSMLLNFESLWGV